METNHSESNWEQILDEQMPAIINGLRGSQLKLLDGRPPTVNRRFNSHNHPELCVVTRGTIEVLNEGELIRVRAREVLLVAPRMLHETRAVGRSAETLWMAASPNHLGSQVARFDAQGGHETLGALDFLDFPPANRILTQLIDELNKRERGWLSLCKGLLNMLFAQALRQLGTDGRPLPPHEDWSDAQVVAFNARDFVQRNYSRDVTLAQVAHHVALSPNYLASLFKKQFGRTIIDFLTEVRIEAAKQLLERSDTKISQIAEQVGYNSPYYFSRAFKKVVRCSPKEFRDRTR
ncbi:MAG: helix-turn-helix transcriptional regulator [Planctomycetes bacterium]|nr:helix-turn-helix transcriptional regulator [Planctomycetota bacterium]